MEKLIWDLKKLVANGTLTSEKADEFCVSYVDEILLCSDNLRQSVFCGSLDTLLIMACVERKKGKSFTVALCLQDIVTGVVAGLSNLGVKLTRESYERLNHHFGENSDRIIIDMIKHYVENSDPLNLADYFNLGETCAIDANGKRLEIQRNLSQDQKAQEFDSTFQSEMKKDKPNIRVVVDKFLELGTWCVTKQGVIDLLETLNFPLNQGSKEQIREELMKYNNYDAYLQTKKQKSEYQKKYRNEHKKE